MELFQLRCFLAVAETENISQAARNGAPPETAQAVSLLTSLLQAERAEIDRFLSPAF